MLVTLETCTNSAAVTTTYSDAVGMYSFDGVLPGCYVVVFGVPTGLTATSSNVGSDNTDSDINAQGRTGSYTLAQNTQLTDVDAGFTGQPSGQ